MYYIIIVDSRSFKRLKTINIKLNLRHETTPVKTRMVYINFIYISGLPACTTNEMCTDKDCILTGI